MSEGSPDREFQALRALSAALGRNRFRTQAAGGNTSIKRDGVMWIKASGRQLADALDQDIMVPVALDGLRAAALRNDPAADGAVPFVIEELNPAKLRPSIETSVHAIIPHTVVAHIHCVETIALAVRENARELVADRLEGLQGMVWAFVPYRRPGRFWRQRRGSREPDGASLPRAFHGAAAGAARRYLGARRAGAR